MSTAAADVEEARDTNKWTKNGFGENIPRSSAGGKYSKEESQKVRQAVIDYCAAKQITADRLCSECEHKAELKGAWMEIARALPHRCVQSVYRHGLRILHPFNRGAWTDLEIEKLFHLVTKLGKKWVAIQNNLNRSADACRDKYREMSEDYVRGRWKDEETEELKRIIRQHLQVDPNARMDDIAQMAEAEGMILPWSIISVKIGTRSRLSCFKKFQKMAGISSSSEDGKRGKLPPAQHAASFQAAAGTTTATSATTSVANRKDAETSAAAVDDDLSHYDDDIMLSELVQSGAHQASEIQWGALRGNVEYPQQRWNNLVMEWQQQEGEEATEEALASLPFCELAQLLLDRKTSAKMAAETVEAVNLPVV